MENFAKSLEPMPSNLMRAIALVLNADSTLSEITEPHYDLELEYVDWPSIFKLSLTEEQKTVVLWAQSLWLGHTPDKTDLIRSSANLNPYYRLAILDSSLHLLGL